LIIDTAYLTTPVKFEGAINSTRLFYEALVVRREMGLFMRWSKERVQYDVKKK